MGFDRFSVRAAGWHVACFTSCGMLNPIAGNLERYMDLLAARQKLVASNIANADTPGYKTRDIDFQFEFMSLANGAGTNPRAAAPNVINAPDLAAKNDGNNVSIDRESRLLSETALRFNLASSLLRGQIQLVRSAIKEGRTG